MADTGNRERMSVSEWGGQELGDDIRLRDGARASPTQTR